MGEQIVSIAVLRATLARSRETGETKDGQSGVLSTSDTAIKVVIFRAIRLANLLFATLCPNFSTICGQAKDGAARKVCG